MKRSVLKNAKTLNIKKYLLLVAVGITTSLVSNAQGTNTQGSHPDELDNVGNQTIPELVFQNPVLMSGVDKQEGAKYRFANVAAGIDAIMEVKKKKDNNVVLNTVDLNSSGWNKAFQPELGRTGTVGPLDNWWIKFRISFVKSDDNSKKVKIKKFYVTALDVDGDNQSVQEYVQMSKPDSVKYSPVSYLTALVPIVTDILPLAGDLLEQGPVQNFTNIDTAATGVMVTYVFQDVDNLEFTYGGKSNLSSSTAGMRLNSMWFKSFSLEPSGALPVKLTSFSALYDKKDVSLSWSANEDNFSHYVLQRSTDGKNYSDIALIFAGAGANATYSYKDKNVLSSTNSVFYRLQMVDIDKDFTYSPVRAIRLGKEPEAIQLTTYPNPVTDGVHVTLPASWQSKAVTIELYTASGILVKSMEYNNASQTETLQFGQISKGFYLVKASCGDQVAQQRIIKN